MHLYYLPVKFKIIFDNPAFVDNNPLFVLRGLLGKNLRGMCCVSRGSECSSCMYNKTCVYSYVFETIMEKETNVLLPGADRASHPFAITDADFVKIGDTIKEYSFTITLFGKTHNYLPYIYAAFLRASEQGIFKSRSTFEIVSATVNEKSIIIDKDKIDVNISPLSIECDCNKLNNLDRVQRKIEVNLKTPLRFKSHGKYTKDFSALEFFRCLNRRVKTLFVLYGDGEFNFPEYNQTEVNLVSPDLKWESNKRYSGRQKKVMELCGVEGRMILEGTFTDYELFLLKFSSITNAGKNTNFGLGQIEFSYKI